MSPTGEKQGQQDRSGEGQQDRAGENHDFQ